MSHSLAVRHRFVQLRTQGLSYDKIARELEVSKHTLINWGRELAPELSILRALRIETLQEELLAAHEHRLRLIHDQMARIQAELATRDLKTLSTATLFRLLLTHVQALKRETIDPFAALQDLDLSRVNPVLLLTAQDVPPADPRTIPAPKPTQPAPAARPQPSDAVLSIQTCPVGDPKSKIQNSVPPDRLDQLLDDLLRVTADEKAQAQAFLDRHLTPQERQKAEANARIREKMYGRR